MAVALFAAVILAAGGAYAQTTWYVDDDAPNDPGPGDPTISDPLEDGSPEHPFDVIQEGIDAAVDGDTIIVLPSTGSPGGAYTENIAFPAEAITLRSINPQDPALVEATAIRAASSGSVVTFSPGAPGDAVLDGFFIRDGVADSGGGIHCESASPTITNCIVAYNTGVIRGAGISCAAGAAPTIRSCVLRNNYGGGLGCDQSSPTVVDCRIVDN